MPPKGWRKHQAEPEASTKDCPNDTPAAPTAVELTFTYRNWRGEVAERTVRPIRFWRGATEWHPEDQVFLRALDTARGVERDFAVRDIWFTPIACERTAELTAADASLLKIVRKIARWNPAAALPEFRGPLTADIQALKAALAEYDAARSET